MIQAVMKTLRSHTFVCCSLARHFLLMHIQSLVTIYCHNGQQAPALPARHFKHTICSVSR
ncbi:hypothetical protein HMPREF1870_00629 [Bacteroidales bacterium KA00344]|nr:hypothetical protein HMPREF1870_00629 [Bacteroidales bacterium KA00344]